jgi:hypothetical protein
MQEPDRDQKKKRLKNTTGEAEKTPKRRQIDK